MKDIIKQQYKEDERMKHAEDRTLVPKSQWFTKSQSPSPSQIADLHASD
jgi:hypothetical protein